MAKTKPAVATKTASEAKVPGTSVPASFATGNIDSAAAPKGTNTLNPPIPTDKEVIAKAKAEQAARDQVAKDAAAKVKADAKAVKDKEKADAKAVKDEARAKTKAERDARIADLAASGKSYTGSMLALADRVKQGVYVKGSTGQLRSNDQLAQALDGVSPTDVVKLGLDVLKIEDNPYAALNVGQQSMNLRNRMRGAIKKETLTIADINAYIERNKIHVTSAADIEAAKQAKADKKAAAVVEAKAKADAAAQAKADAAAKAKAAAPVAETATKAA